MKKTYIAPRMMVHETGAENDYCLLADSSKGTNGFGTTTTNGVKDEFNGDIEFSDMTGTDMFKRNPWDSQW